ncbi:MAG TPA: 5-deoxy-glucuronate isomerase [Clostridiaceae bacterium]|nr:5-deoxy-glucuronate isomerase [Clostridiaceae bacterium]
MYIDKELKRGYNEYTNVDVRDGEGSLMDVGMLIMEDGDTYEFGDEKKEISWLMFVGKATVEYNGKTVEMERPNPFDYNPWCLLMSAGDSCKLTAHDHCEFYVQATYNDTKYETVLYTPDDTDTWRRGADGELNNLMKRDVRTCYDYENAPFSKMVLGEVVNLPGRWSSYPPHSHPQPEVYLYYFEKPMGFGASWVDGEVHEVHHHGASIITEGTHQQVMAPGYACCYTWGIRHFDDNPWEKTRIDDPTHEWLLDDPQYWGKDDD